MPGWVTPQRLDGSHERHGQSIRRRSIERSSRHAGWRDRAIQGDIKHREERLSHLDATLRILDPSYRANTTLPSGLRRPGRCLAYPNYEKGSPTPSTRTDCSHPCGLGFWILVTDSTLIHSASVSSIAIWAVRILRRLPHTRQFDKHLTDCAALHLLYAPYGDASESLKLKHVLKVVSFPNFLPCCLEPMNAGIGSPKSGLPYAQAIHSNHRISP